MTAERCGELCAIAITNKLPESWIAIFPIIPLTYTAIYFPIVFRWYIQYSYIFIKKIIIRIIFSFIKVLGPQYLFKLRDSRDTTVLTEVHTI